MRNIYITLILVFATFQGLTAQVHLNVAPGDEEASAILQIDAIDKGVSLPNVALISTTDNETIPSPKDGLLVYNVNTVNDVVPGFYYRYNNSWQPVGKINDTYILQQQIDLDVLGYTPSNTGITADNSTGNISGSGSGEGDLFTEVRYVKLGCVKWEESVGGNGHTYCAYSRQEKPLIGSFSNNGGDWNSAYNFARTRGGYLVTITSDAEKNWIQTNVITPKSLTSDIWIGYNKYKSRYIPLAGNNEDAPFATHRYKWITGEKWSVNWENTSGAVVQHNFSSGQPSIVNTNGCAYISSGGTRQWDDRACTTADANTHHIIVEFQDIY